MQFSARRRLPVLPVHLRIVLQLALCLVCLTLCREFTLERIEDPVFFLQGFTLGGVVATFGLALDGIGFVLLLIFVLTSSVILVRRGNSRPDTPPAIA